MTMWAHTHITFFLQACTIRSFHPCHNQLQINIAKMKLALTSRVASALTTPKSDLAEGSFDCTALYNSTQKLAVIFIQALACQNWCRMQGSFPLQPNALAWGHMARHILHEVWLPNHSCTYMYTCIICTTKWAMSDHTVPKVAHAKQESYQCQCLSAYIGPTWSLLIMLHSCARAPAAYRLPCMSSPVEPCRKSRCTLGGLVEHPY